MITHTILAFALALPQSPTVLPETEPVFVELTAGRGMLLAGEHTARLSSQDGEQWVEGRGHLSLMASATAVLRWHGRASLELSGPCEFEWEACAPEETLEWTFQSFCRAEIESRHSEILIHLGDTWSVWMPPGAMQIRSLPNRQFELLQEAGALASYRWEGAQGHTRPLQETILGRPVRLGPQPRASRPDHSARLDGRAHYSWPWRNARDDAAVWGFRDWPWVAPSRQPVTVRIVQAPQPEPVHTPAPEVIVEAPAEPAPAPVELPEEPILIEAPAVESTLEDPAPAPPPATELEPDPDGEGTWGWDSHGSESAGTWRGLSEEGYRPFGDYFIQSRTGILSEELPDGGVRFWIPEDLKVSGWVLGPRLDARLDSGGSIEFGPSGALREHSGGVRVLAALER